MQFRELELQCHSLSTKKQQLNSNIQILIMRVSLCVIFFSKITNATYRRLKE